MRLVVTVAVCLLVVASCAGCRRGAQSRIGDATQPEVVPDAERVKLASGCNVSATDPTVDVARARQFLKSPEVQGADLDTPEGRQALVIKFIEVYGEDGARQRTLTMQSPDGTQYRWPRKASGGGALAR